MDLGPGLRREDGVWLRRTNEKAREPDGSRAFFSSAAWGGCFDVSGRGALRFEGRVGQNDQAEHFLHPGWAGHQIVPMGFVYT
jgi:hypothetical protein